MATLQDAARNNHPHFVIPAGAYCFNGQMLLLTGAKNMLIDATAAVFWFSYGGGLVLWGCSNVTWRGGVIDYDPPVYAQGTITSMAGAQNGFIRAAFDTSYALPDSSFGVFHYFADGNTKVAFFNPATDQMRRQTDNRRDAAINIWLASSEPIVTPVPTPPRHRPVTAAVCELPADAALAIAGRARLGGDTGGGWCGGVAGTQTASFDLAAKDRCEAYYVDPYCATVPDASSYVAGSCVGGCRTCAYELDALSDGWGCVEGPEVWYGCPTVEYNLQTLHLEYLLEADAPRVGDPVTVMPRGYPHAFMVAGSEGMLIDGVAVHGGHNMGILEAGGQGGNTYMNVDVVRRPNSGHLLSVNADGFHSANAAVGATVRNAHVRHTGDDLLNITPRIMLVLSVSGSTMLLLDPGSTSELIGGGSVVSIYTPPVAGPSRPGRKAAITLIDAPRRTAAAEAQAAVNAAKGPCNYVTSHNTDHFFLSGYVWTYTAGQPIPGGVRMCDLAQDLTKANVAPSVSNSTFDSSYARAGLFKCNGEVLRDCSFSHAGGLWVGIEPSWLEGALDFGQVPVTLDEVRVQSLGDPWLNILPGSSCDHVRISGGAAPPSSCSVPQRG
jgi:hypothetical protein